MLKATVDKKLTNELENQKRLGQLTTKPLRDPDMSPNANTIHTEHMEKHSGRCLQRKQKYQTTTSAYKARLRHRYQIPSAAYVKKTSNPQHMF